jgi:hypothetical protein
LKKWLKLEAADGIGQIDDVIEKTGAIMDFYLRITGSAIGTRLQGSNVWRSRAGLFSSSWSRF